MRLTADNFDLLKAVNDCQIADLKKAQPTDCAEFYRRARNAEAAVIHTYQITGHASLREADSLKAANLWKDMVKFCESVIVILKDLRQTHPGCGAAEVYNVALDYRGEAQRRYFQNLQDSECQTIPEGIFPPVN